MSAPAREALARYWPLYRLRLATPALTLLPLSDEDIPDLVALMVGGIHDKDAMPFAVPWTDAPEDELIGNALRHFWSVRAATRPTSWSVHFVVRRSGTIIGIQELSAEQFALRRAVASGSWLGRAYQRQGFGTEMRSAVLQFAFDHLKATRAQSDAFVDNPASLRVSRALGYVENGTALRVRRPGEVVVNQRLLLTPGTFRRPSWMVQVAGLPACAAELGI